MVRQGLPAGEAEGQLKWHSEQEHLVGYRPLIGPERGRGQVLSAVLGVAFGGGLTEYTCVPPPVLQTHPGSLSNMRKLTTTLSTTIKVQ